MGLVVEARHISAVGPGGLLFTSVSAMVSEGDLAVIAGPPTQARTALLLALCGRFVTVAGTLSPGPQALRRRIVVAQAHPTLVPDSRMTVKEALRESRLIGGSTYIPQAVWDACETLALDTPALGDCLADLSPRERLLFTAALACGHSTPGIALDDADAGLSMQDRDRVRQALRALTEQGKTILTTSADPGWGTVSISLNGPACEHSPPSPPQESDGREVQPGDQDGLARESDL